MTNDIERYEDRSRYVHVKGDLLGHPGGQGAVFRTYAPDIAIKLIGTKEKCPLDISEPLGKEYHRRLEKLRQLPLPQ